VKRISAIFMTRTSSSKADHAGKKVELGSNIAEILFT
jgi:hypothetical protein